MIRSTVIDKQSPFLGDECSLCKQPLAPGDEAVVCPEDGSRHHSHCWRSNGNKCTAYGCRGEGAIVSQTTEPRRPYRHFQTIETVNRPRRRSKVLVRPTSHLGCARGCLLLSIAMAIILFAVGCFGLWAIADYIMVEIFNLPYRSPVSELAPALSAAANLRILVGLL